METDLQNAFGKSIGEVARDIADFLSTPFVIGAEHPVELCSLIEGLNMHGQFSFALLSEALAGGMTLAEAEAFYLRVCAPLMDDEIVRQTLAAFRDRESEDYRTLLQKYGNDFPQPPNIASRHQKMNHSPLQTKQQTTKNYISLHETYISKFKTYVSYYEI